jgi:hypothetical protein
VTEDRNPEHILNRSKFENKFAIAVVLTLGIYGSGIQYLEVNYGCECMGPHDFQIINFGSQFQWPINPYLKF